MTWKVASVSQKTKFQKFQKLQKDLQSKDNIKKYSQKKGKDLKKGNIINDNKTLHEVLQLKLINYLLEDESKFEIYGNTLLEKVRKFCENSQITKSITNKIYDEYESLKKEIKKEKDKTKWTKAYPNKLKKQATHLLLGKSKLKSLAAKDEKTIARMAADNKLTVPDLKVILKYKLENEYLGEISNEIYNSKHNKHPFCNELKTFYGDFKNNDKDREKIIKKLYSDYCSIKNQINISKEIKMKLSESKEYQSIKLGDYNSFKEYIKESLNKFLDLIDTCGKKESKRTQWQNELKEKYPKEVITKVQDYLFNDKLLGLYSRNNMFTETFAVPLRDLNSNNAPHLFNMFKLFDYKEIYKREDFHIKFGFIFSVCTYNIMYENCKDSLDEEFYILKTTREKIKELLKKEKEKVLQKGTKPPIPKKPLPLTPDEEKEMLELLNSMPLPKNVKSPTPDQLKKLDVGKLKDNPNFKKILSKFESQSKKSSNPYKKS